MTGHLVTAVASIATRARPDTAAHFTMRDVGRRVFTVNEP